MEAAADERRTRDERLRWADVLLGQRDPVVGGVVAAGRELVGDRVELRVAVEPPYPQTLAALVVLRDEGRIERAHSVGQPRRAQRRDGPGHGEAARLQPAVLQDLGHLQLVHVRTVENCATGGLEPREQRAPVLLHVRVGPGVRRRGQAGPVEALRRLLRQVDGRVGQEPLDDLDAAGLQCRGERWDPLGVVMDDVDRQWRRGGSRGRRRNHVRGLSRCPPGRAGLR